jgi:ParB-like chromosome segregation protein Spo0J
MSRYQILPPLSPDDEDRLKASIKERGVEVPVIKDENGDIIDGHNRAMIADSLGIDYPVDVKAGLSESQKRLLAVDLNLARRQLTDAQKVLLGRQIEPDVAEEARQRQAHGKTAPGRSVTSDAERSEPTRSVDEVAKKVGLGSGRTYERAKQVIEAIEKQPDGELLIQQVESGTWDIPDAKTELKQRKVDWTKPSNVTALPRPGDRATPEILDGVAQVFYDAQLPYMVAQAVLEAQQHITKGSQRAQAALKRIDWNDVTDDMLADESIVDAVHYTHAELARFFAAFKQAERSHGAIRSVK